MCEQVYIEERERKRQTNFHHCSYPVVAYIRTVYYTLLINGFNGCCLTVSAVLQGALFWWLSLNRLVWLHSWCLPVAPVCG